MTQHTATQSLHGCVQLEHATVKTCTDAGLIVHGPAGVATAQAAAGCLVEPMAGDRVLVSRSGRECFVLTVLARQGDGRSIRVSGELTVSARRLTLHGDEGTDLGDTTSLDLHSPRVTVAGQDTEVQAQRLRASAAEGRAHFRQIRVVADTIEAVSDRIAQCARQVVRRVEEVETLHVGNLVQRVRENLLSRSKRASITASKDVHIDGERIHMG